jgi:uncharacterized phage infection (PIP) family protein YhgE
MQFPERSKRFEWNFNTLVVIGGLSFATVANVAVAAIAWNDTKRDITDIQDKLKSETERGIKADIDLNKAVAEIGPLTYQTTRAIEGVAENKKGIEAANARIDRVVEALGGKLDTAIDSINKVATRVEVLSSKLDDAQTRANKTLYGERRSSDLRQGSEDAAHSVADGSSGLGRTPAAIRTAFARSILAARPVELLSSQNLLGRLLPFHDAISRTIASSIA